jgi:hypothetical protein
VHKAPSYQARELHRINREPTPKQSPHGIVVRRVTHPFPAAYPSPESLREGIAEAEAELANPVGMTREMVETLEALRAALCRLLTRSMN